MPTDLPTASVTGRQEWKWNQWRTGRDSTEPANRQSGRSDSREPRSRERKATRSQRTGAVTADTGDASPPRRVIEELEAKERRIQYVIRHYERLLAEKDRKLAAENDSGSTTGLPVLSTVCQYVNGD